MGIKLLRGTTGRGRREVFSRELIDFETEFESIWHVHERIGPDRPNSQGVPGNGELKAKNREESPEGGMEPVVEPPSPVKMSYPPV